MFQFAGNDRCDLPSSWSKYRHHSFHGQRWLHIENRTVPDGRSSICHSSLLHFIRCEYIFSKRFTANYSVKKTRTMVHPKSRTLAPNHRPQQKKNVVILYTGFLFIYFSIKLYNTIRCPNSDERSVIKVVIDCELWKSEIVVNHNHTHK